MKYIFLDTNIFLHCIDFEQIPWEKIFDDSDIAIVIPDMVMKEIDKIKDGPVGHNGKAKNRAKKISKKFAEYLIFDKKPNKYNVIHVDNPSIEFLKENNLLPESQDDNIIGSIMFFNHLDESVVVSRDNGMLIRAKTRGIPFKTLSDEFNFAEEKTEVEKELEDYKNRLDALTSMSSKLQLYFDNGSDEITFEVPEDFDLDAALLAKLDEIREKHPHVIRPQNNKVDDNILDAVNPELRKLLCETSEMVFNFNSRFNFVTDEQICEHNKALDAYYAKCEDYFKIKLKADYLDSIIKELSFIVRNEGYMPSGEMLIYIGLPQHVQFFSNKNKSRYNIEEPEAPEPHGINISIPKFPSLSFGLYGPYYDPPHINCWNLEKPIEDKRLNISHDGLLHHCHCDINIKGSLFINITEITEFEIPWVIIDGNNPNKTQGRLKVKIIRKNQH